MAPSLLTITEAGINLGDRWLLRGASLSLHAGDKLALVGVNGAGKSSLMKLLAGQGEMDEGTLWIAPGTTVAYLPQAPLIPEGISLRDIVVGNTDISAVGHKADNILKLLNLDPYRNSTGLSGGEARRVSLARAIFTQPDIILLDEPTNHMDLPTIEWMETRLGKHKGAILVVSHDRAFLKNIGTGIIWLHNGKLLRRDGHFDEFDNWSNEILTKENTALHKLDRRISEENKWLREGLSARRKRNQGRLRELKKIREGRSKLGSVAQRGIQIETGSAQDGGQLVLEAKELNAIVPTDNTSNMNSRELASNRRLINRLNLLIRRGDRIGIIGPNGIGKSTLVRILLKLEQADKGRVKHGFGFKPAYFDQKRESLDRDKSPWVILTGGGSDTIEIDGKPRHVVRYLRDFLFDETKMTQRVATLSGGEQNRLLLAKLFAQPHNFLVLDEPTNDLDLETLELLQEVIADYDGTVLIVSHDRDFLDRTVTKILAFEGNGKVTAHAGGYSDYLERRKLAIARKSLVNTNQKQKKDPRINKKVRDKGSPKRPPRLTYIEKYAFENLPVEIGSLEKRIALLEVSLSDPTLFISDPGKFKESAEELNQLKLIRDEKELEWFKLVEKADEVEI